MFNPDWKVPDGSRARPFPFPAGTNPSPALGSGVFIHEDELSFPLVWEGFLSLWLEMEACPPTREPGQGQTLGRAEEIPLSSSKRSGHSMTVDSPIPAGEKSFLWHGSLLLSSGEKPLGTPR